MVTNPGSKTHGEWPLRDDTKVAYWLLHMHPNTHVYTHIQGHAQIYIEDGKLWKQTCKGYDEL